MTVRIAFLGTPQVAVPPLRGLVADERVEVAAVITNPDRARGRSSTPKPPPVKAAAQELGLDVWQPERPSEVVDDLRALELDAAAVVAYGAILREEVLDSVRAGFVNLHYSLLPRWRGAAPVQHALMAGDDVTGLTAFKLDPGMDTGPILLQETEQIGEHDTAGDLLERLTERGAPLLADAVVGLADGTLTPQPQDEDGATVAPKIQTDDVAVDWTASAREVADLVRGANPRPGAHTTWRGGRCKLHDARVTAAQAPHDAAPGAVVATTDEGPEVACGDGAVVLHVLQPAGKQRTGGRDFVNGHQPEPGERFGV